MTKKEKYKIISKIIKDIESCHLNDTNFPYAEDYNVSEDIINEIDREFWKQYWWSDPSFEQFELKITQCDFSKIYEMFN